MKEVGMKRSVVMTCILLLVAFFLAGVAAAQEMGKMETATGVVTSVDPQGTAITILWKVANEELDVGTIVDNDTVVKVNGKTATLQDIKVGDKVTIRYLKSDNLYAKEITKK
jgi:Cu/Ag efflux protein CusF